MNNFTVVWAPGKFSFLFLFHLLTLIIRFFYLCSKWPPHQEKMALEMKNFPEFTMGYMGLVGIDGW